MSEAVKPLRIVAATVLAMIAFAGNSVLARLALDDGSIDAATFTTIRLASGALVLWIVVALRGGTSNGTGNWPSAFALFVYAAAFSFAYVTLPTAMGALLLFGAVQLTMIAHGLRSGERLHLRQTLGLILAVGGLVALLLPGVARPSVLGSTLMVAAGVSWGVYSLRGRGAGDPVLATAGNFLRAVPLAIAISLVSFQRASFDPIGVGYAVASGALASGIGYAIWYTALPGLQTTSAATVQLSVPVLAAVGGLLFLGESVTMRLVFASLAILGGIALVIVAKQERAVHS